MTTRLAGNGGHISWGGERDEEGHRTYKITYLVIGDITDGPANALQTPGLPYPGAYWIVDNDIDVWAWCRLNASIKSVLNKEPNKYWEIEFTFSTKPYKRCSELQFEDPLLEPPRVSGSSSVQQVEATYDRFGRPVVNSCWEFIHGKGVEFDWHMSHITIEQNVALLELELCQSMRNTVNDAILWGCAARTIKLANFDWDEKYHGPCQKYFTRKFKFDVDTRQGWDKTVLDEGTKVLNGRWNTTTGEYDLVNIAGVAPDPYNPKHFVKFADRRGNPCRAMLNGAGLPAGVVSGSGRFAVAIASSTGVALTDRTKWLPCQDPTKAIEEMNFFKAFSAGAIAHDGGTYYVAKRNVPPEFVSSSDTDFATYWGVVTSTLSAIVFAGNYSVSTAYVAGKIVRDVGATVQGIIHVSKYDESNFLLLGVPPILGV